eukprot:6203045-Pleurochrysis_carterae.AAC.1
MGYACDESGAVSVMSAPEEPRPPFEQQRSWPEEAQHLHQGAQRHHLDAAAAQQQMAAQHAMHAQQQPMHGAQQWGGPHEQHEACGCGGHYLHGAQPMQTAEERHHLEHLQALRRHREEQMMRQQQLEEQIMRQQQQEQQLMRQREEEERLRALQEQQHAEQQLQLQRQQQLHHEMGYSHNLPHPADFEMQHHMASQQRWPQQQQHMYPHAHVGGQSLSHPSAHDALPQQQCSAAYHGGGYSDNYYGDAMDVEHGSGLMYKTAEQDLNQNGCQTQ